MAEFNLFMGTARKSIGDITLYRKDGRQMARVRVRTIGNPKSEGQSTQRNFVAPVTKFYAPFADVLARSYEGLNKSDSYNLFLKTNIRLARENGWFLDKGAPFTPLPYQLSRGSLRPLTYRLDEDETGNEGNIDIAGLVGYQATMGTISEALVANGYKEGDVITIIAVVRSTNGGYLPYSFQFYVNTLDSRTPAAIAPAGLGLSPANNLLVVTANGLSVDAVAAIVSRPSKRGWLRSTQFLAVASSIVTQLTSAQQKADAIASYGPQDSGTGGDVYLDGDGQAFNVASASGRALLFYGGQYNCQVIHNLQYHVVKLKPANLDDYFFVRYSTGVYLCSNSSDSLTPADWSFQSSQIGTLNPDFIIDAPAGSTMQSYLATIGVPL